MLNFRPEQTPPTESTRPNNNRGRQKEPQNRYVRWLDDDDDVGEPKKWNTRQDTTFMEINIA